MLEIRKSLELDIDEYYKTHLAIINPILPVRMTEKEIEVLAAFMALTGDIAKDRFGTTGRKLVREKVKINFQGMSNYLDQLSKKEMIFEVEGKYNILPLLIPEPNQQFYKFRLFNKVTQINE